MSIKLFPLLFASAATFGLSDTASATSIFGSLGNFDAVNDTGKTAHGFEIELEGIHAGNVTDTFGGAGRGFPSTVERYGAPTVTEYNNGTSWGVHVTYRADLSGPSPSWIGTPTGIYSTPGESCWTGGGSGYGPSTPCDHFGVGLNANPTRTNYNWLVEDTPGSSVLVNASSNVLAPVWTVTPAASPPPGAPPSPPVVAAKIQAPDPEDPGMAWGPAVWVKVFTTELEGPVALEELLGGNPKVQQAEQHTEIEWQLLQRELGNPLSGILENGDAAPVGANAESVLRRYEFYKYAGLYSAEGEALPELGDSNPGANDLGIFIGAQNAALNFGAAAPGGVPEPASWATMLGGFGLIGLMLRSRRKTRIAFG